MPVLVAQPPNAAPSATIPKIRILLIPRPVRIQAQPEGEGNTARATAGLAYCLLGGGRGGSVGDDGNSDREGSGLRSVISSSPSFTVGS
jgi:hypothetical protein